jgi:putative tryptophan/tyrosine transport system substrate-binding protein
MKRREVIAAITALLAAPVNSALSQPKMYRIGYVVPAPAPNPLGLAFDRALTEFGLIDGKNTIVDRRYMGGRESEYPAVLAELERTADVIVVASPPAALIAKKVVTKTPVVFTAVGDPVAIGLVETLAKPGGNLTGVSFDVSPAIASKRLALLKEAFPRVTRVGALWSSTDPVGIPTLRALEADAPSLRVSVLSLDVRRPEDFADVFAHIQKERCDSLLVVGGPVNVVYRTRIAEFTNAQRLPSISISRDYADVGGLMSYGPNLAENVAYAAKYVDRIRKGAKPADLPIEQPSTFELVINLKTAKALNLTIPQSLLLRADEIIQ